MLPCLGASSTLLALSFSKLLASALYGSDPENAPDSEFICAVGTPAVIRSVAQGLRISGRFRLVPPNLRQGLSKLVSSSSFATNVHDLPLCLPRLKSGRVNAKRLCQLPTPG